jgi:hypothetical protein
MDELAIEMMKWFSNMYVRLLQGKTHRIIHEAGITITRVMNH